MAEPIKRDITWKDLLPVARITLVILFIFSLMYTFGVPSFALLAALAKNLGLIFIGFIILRAGVVAVSKSFRDITSQETINSIFGIKSRSAKALATTIILGLLVLFLINPVNLAENARFAAGWLNDIAASILAALGIHGIWRGESK